ncbi:hypothetical protein [Proteiniphilum sp. X52]|uniref:hypothetical protein n=1 Tax=Proteiniphilum sp. X52 TaxID=2382159 RepID=UPI000F0A313E|nr:hypothetical protein [Proteiniphilum sp. X52]RNC66820.1 hypothetical protein D7D25_00705 [Proteiniphilum sp. X52]
MSKKRNEYIDQLLGDLKLLEQRLLSVRESDTLPFSFFSSSFDRIEKISRSLHELELMQIGEMKQQMERLVRFLSESDARGNAVRGVDQEVQQTTPDDAGPPEYSEQTHYEGRSEGSGQPKDSESPEYPSPGMDEMVMEQERAGFTERIILPEYRDPRISKEVPPSVEVAQVLPEQNGEEKRVARSLNDMIQAPPALLDLKRGISLNDRFLFQRELFNNNRQEMNRVMEILNGLGSFDEAENYLKKELNWNFESQTVKEFLLVIKKGFE